jgi:hypothetical protein
MYLIIYLLLFKLMNRSNTIYYKFKSEKKKYSINFDLAEISIADIKKEIIRRRNMEKVPEKFELLFFDENNNEIRDENYKIEPLKLLFIKRIPWYKLSNTFVDKIRDPSEISSLRFSDFVVTARKANVSTLVNIIDPLEKIQSKVSIENFNAFYSCKICTKEEFDPVILNCCGDTVCSKCASEVKNKCQLCEENFKGYMPNKKLKEIIDKIYAIINKPKIEPILTIENDVNDQVVTSPRFAGKKTLPNLTPITNVPIVTQPTTDETTITNPHNLFFENARFFVIKSSNKENVDLSQKYSEWATTVTNQKKLNEAYQSSNVILIFSINKSGNFQGYAVMTSFISDKVSNIWQNESSVKLGGSFSVQWLSICELPFSKVKNLTNPLNSNEFVIKSRDTQELTKDIGISLSNYCFEQEKYDNAYKNKQSFVDIEILTKIHDDIKKSRESKRYLIFRINSNSEKCSYN